MASNTHNSVAESPERCTLNSSTIEEDATFQIISMITIARSTYFVISAVEKICFIVIGVHVRIGRSSQLGILSTILGNSRLGSSLISPKVIVVFVEDSI